MAQGPNATYQGTRSLALWFWRRRFLKSFYHTWPWRPSWSCDPDPANKLPLRLHMKFGFNWPSGFGEDLWKWWTDGQRMEDRTCLYYKLTNEPKCSGELKTYNWAMETSGLKSNSSELLCLSWLPATLMMIRSKMNELTWRHYFPIISLCEIFRP